MAPSLRWLGQPSPGTARPEFCPSETAVRGVSNGQDPATAEPQTQAALYSKGVPVQDTAQKWETCVQLSDQQVHDDQGKAYQLLWVWSKMHSTTWAPTECVSLNKMAVRSPTRKKRTGNQKASCWTVQEDLKAHNQSRVNVLVPQVSCVPKYQANSGKEKPRALQKAERWFEVYTSTLFLVFI